MAIITSLKQQKSKNRVNVYLDGKFGFGLDIDNLVIFNLKVGQEVSEKKIEEIVGRAEFQEVLNKLLRFAMVRPRSEKEYKDYFFRKKVPEVMRDELLAKLGEFGLMDDEKFSRWWIESRQNFAPKSRRVVEYELKAKGIKKEIIDKTLEENKIDEEKVAGFLLEQRENHWKNMDEKTRGVKMVAYLIGKGFGFEIAKKAGRRYNQGGDDKVKQEF